MTLILLFSLTGSPFTVKVTGEGRMKESITRRRQAPSIATIGSTCDLNLKIPGRQPRRRKAREGRGWPWGCTCSLNLHWGLWLACLPPHLLAPGFL